MAMRPDLYSPIHLYSTIAAQLLADVALLHDYGLFDSTPVERLTVSDGAA
jgi:hypothetical protein